MEDPVILEDGRVCERGNVSALGYTGAVQAHDALRAGIQAYFILREATKQRQEDWHAFLARRERCSSKALEQRQRQIHGLRARVEQTRQTARDLKASAGDLKASAADRKAASCRSPNCTATPSPAALAPARTTSTLTAATEAPSSGAASEPGTLARTPESPEESVAEELGPSPSFTCGPAPRTAAQSAVPPRLRRSTWSSLLPVKLPRA